MESSMATSALPLKIRLLYLQKDCFFYALNLTNLQGLGREKQKTGIETNLQGVYKGFTKAVYAFVCAFVCAFVYVKWIL
jgi:hypothetical protein